MIYDLTRTGDGVPYRVKAVVGVLFYVLGYGALFIAGGLIVSVVPVWLWVILGLPS